MGESRTILTLATILSFRMLGLFMIYPVFALYAPTFKYASATSIGIAMGIYGLTQAMFQLPLSMWSDRIGRRPVIIGGLIVFALGSFVSALAHNIYLVIVGRALQGAGAIGSTLMAYAADLTPINNRTKTMAILGMSIGASFALAMLFGPLINAWFHLSGIFWLTALLAFSGILLLKYAIPATSQTTYRSSTTLGSALRSAWQHPVLLKLNVSILLLHALLTASFIVVPTLFLRLGSPANAQWKLYLPVLFGAFLLTFPLIMFAEKKQRVKEFILLAIIVIALSEFLFYQLPLHTVTLCLALLLFFTGFTTLEAILPSLVSKIANPHQKGAHMGIFSSFQFLGIFLGGAIAGLLQRNYSDPMIFVCSFAVCVLWLIAMASGRGLTVTNTLSSNPVTQAGERTEALSKEDGIV